LQSQVNFAQVAELFEHSGSFEKYFGPATHDRAVLEIVKSSRRDAATSKFPWTSKREGAGATLSGRVAAWEKDVQVKLWEEPDREP